MYQHINHGYTCVKFPLSVLGDARIQKISRGGGVSKRQFCLAGDLQRSPLSPCMDMLVGFFYGNLIHMIEHFALRPNKCPHSLSTCTIVIDLENWTYVSAAKCQIMYNYKWLIHVCIYVYIKMYCWKGKKQSRKDMAWLLPPPPCDIHSKAYCVLKIKIQ